MTEATYPTAVTWMAQASDGSQACFEAWSSWQQELARFADLRLAENRRTWDALMSSRDLAGLLNAHQSWALQATTDYAQEAPRLTRLFTSLSLTGTTPAVQESAALLA